MAEALGCGARLGEARSQAAFAAGSSDPKSGVSAARACFEDFLGRRRRDGFKVPELGFRCHRPRLG